MLRSRIFLGLLIAVCTLLAAGPAFAGKIGSNLVEALEQADANEYLKIYFTLADQLDLQQPVEEAAIAGGGLARRHYEVITQLQDWADMSQRPIREALEQAKAFQEVKKIRSFWIVNSFAVDAKPGLIKALAEMKEIKNIFLDAPIELIKPVGGVHQTSAAGKGVENGVTVTRAPELWALGIDGTGRLACDQDTGADGTHPAFADRWRGLDPGVAPGDAWFDPLENETFPTESGWNTHGTHTLGTMIGDDGAGNQIGMAPGAKWIGAKTIDTGGDIFSDAVAAFQWMADPDGNPATMDDVPDVVNNSWGLHPSWYGECVEDFNAGIDAAEAAGVVVVFAAGNEGPSSNSLRSPASRIAGDYNVFSIGALEQDGATIADFSSRGPSHCDDATIKPEVSAIGVDVRSAQPGNTYAEMSGTSMATPHVAGAVLLLRQAYPEATPEEIKMALYLTAVDLGTPGEDNTFGMGGIDVVEAYNFLLDYFISSDGRVEMGEAFSCADEITVKVADSDLPDPSIEVEIWSDTERAGETVTLYSPEQDGFYEGTIETASGSPAVDGVLQVSDGDTVIVKYVDANDGYGHFNVVKTATAYVDCAPPAFAGLQNAVGGDQVVELSWNAATDASPVVYNIYRAGSPGAQNFSEPLATTSTTSFNDETVINLRKYFYVVRAQDSFGHEDVNTVELEIRPIGPVLLWEETWEDAKWLHEWEIVDGGSSRDTWTDANPCDRSIGLMDGTFMIVDSDCAGSSVNMSEQLISESINLAGYESIVLRFANYLYHLDPETADVDISYNNGVWNNLARYTGDVDEITELALAGTPDTIKLRFNYYNANYEWYWAIDNIQVLGMTPPCDRNSDCDDGVYCNGIEECVENHCAPGAPPCDADGNWCDGEEFCNELTDRCEYLNVPDCGSDDLWCNGEEFCNDETDSCDVRDIPDCGGDGLWCNGGEFCNDETDACDVAEVPDCLDDELWCNGEEFCNDDIDACDHQNVPDCADDGRFCNGDETCNEGLDECLSSGNPCDVGETCVELTDECVERPADDDAVDDDAADDDDDDDDDTSADDDDDDNTGCGC